MPVFVFLNSQKRSLELSMVYYFKLQYSKEF